MRVLVVGAGATGGYFGGRLAAAGRDVTFLARGARAAQLAARGLRIRPYEGEPVTVQPRVVTAEELIEPFDLILITVKATGLAAAISDVAPAVGDGTWFIPLLNGMAHIDLVQRRVGPERVLGGVVQIVGTLEGDGDVRQMTSMHHMAVGRLPETRISPKNLDLVRDELDGAEFPFEVSEDVTAAMWGKWTMIASAGAMCCLMRGTVGDIVADEDGRALARGLLTEAAAVAAGYGSPLSQGSYESSLERLTEPGSQFTSSMYRDLVAERPTEGEHLLGDLTRRARRVGVSTPLFDLAALHVRVHERRLDGS